MHSKEAPITERIGVAMLNTFFSKCGWLFREQPVLDYGIDAQVEVVEEGIPTGRLVAIQIKTGKSFFEEISNGAYVLRNVKALHYEYWMSHALPVIVILCDPDEKEMFWVQITEDTFISTGKGWKVLVPAENKLTEASLAEISSLSNLPESLQKYNRLRLDKNWMQMVLSGETVYIEFEDWIHKSLPRFNFRIGCESRNDINEMQWPMLYGPGASVARALKYVIPWADFLVDEDAHREYMEGLWEAECYMGHDKEDGVTYYTMTFNEWYEPPEGIVPVGNSAGEVDDYRLLLVLNDVGKAFLTLEDFLDEEKILLVGAQ